MLFLSKVKVVLFAFYPDLLFCQYIGNHHWLFGILLPACFWCQILSMGIYLFNLSVILWWKSFWFSDQYIGFYRLVTEISFLFRTLFRKMDIYFSVIMPKGFVSSLVLPIWFQESISTCQPVYVASKSIWIKYPRFVWNLSGRVASSTFLSDPVRTSSEIISFSLPKSFFPFGTSFEGFLCLRYSIVGSFCNDQSQWRIFRYCADDFQRQFKQIRHVTISVQRDLLIFSLSLFVLCWIWKSFSSTRQICLSV